MRIERAETVALTLEEKKCLTRTTKILKTILENYDNKNLDFISSFTGEVITTDDLKTSLNVLNFYNHGNIYSCEEKF